jgi:indole-3-glycerol phosphate synthase
VGIELKSGEFQPEHLGKLQFYLEALDRDFRKAHEGPTSPALVAEYQTQMPNKKLLQAKLHEFCVLTEAKAE